MFFIIFMGLSGFPGRCFNWIFKDINERATMAIDISQVSWSRVNHGDELSSKTRGLGIGCYIFGGAFTLCSLES